MGLTIAIDGPAASGKGTLARRLADYFHLRHLDTGLTYRAVAHRMMQEGWPLGDGRRAVEAAELVDLGRLDRGMLSAHAVGDAASKVAVFPEVRRILVDKQRAFARTGAGAVLDGRDIGTVIAPEAEVKLYVTASVPARARRRFTEMRARGEAVTLDAIEDDLRRRDARDSGRANAPLRQAEDAMVLDNSNLSPEESIAEALRLVKRALDR